MTVPKHPSQRRNRAKSAPWPKLTTNPHIEFEVPQPPEDWTEYAKEFYWTMWSSPMAATYTLADLPAIRLLVSLADAINDGLRSGPKMAEFRQLSDRYGLSPMARRHLHFEIEKANPDLPKDYSPGERWLRAAG